MANPIFGVPSVTPATALLAAGEIALNVGQSVILALTRKAVFGGVNGVTNPITVDTTIEETYEDLLEITEHPVQVGAQIADHSFKRPMEVRLRCGWSDSQSNLSEFGSLQQALTGSIPSALG